MTTRRNPIDAHLWNQIDARLWLRGRADLEAADYVQGLIEREGTVEFWGFGRTEIRQMKRVGSLIERQGFAVMYLYRPDPRTDSRQFGVTFGPSWYDLDGFSVATRRPR